MGCGISQSDDPIYDGMYVYMSVCQYEPGGNGALSASEWQSQVPYFNKGMPISGATVI